MLFVVMQEGETVRWPEGKNPGTDPQRCFTAPRPRQDRRGAGYPAHPVEGKIVELAVRSVVMGEEVRNVEALANAEALDHFRGIPALEEKIEGRAFGLELRRGPAGIESR